MSAAHTARTHCPNCDHRLAPWDKFCSQCGQDTQHHAPSLWEFVHEFISHYIAAEGRLWKSLWGLMARPGFLTQEYLAGRKQRYVLPLRMVLTLGLVFFLAVRMVPGATDGLIRFDEKAARGPAIAVGEAASAVASSASAGESADADEGPTTSGGVITLPEPWLEHLPSGVRERLARANTAWRADWKVEAKRVTNAMLGWAPYAVLVSLPFFAGLLKLLYWRQPYGAHFVFAMHLHAAWYGLLLLFVLVPWAWAHGAIWLWSNLYPLLALRRVHAIGWWGTLWRGVLLALSHWVLILFGLLSLFLFGALAHA